MHNAQGSSSSKDPEVIDLMDAAVRRRGPRRGGGDRVADEDTRVALADHWLERLRQLRQPGGREPDVAPSAEMYDFSDMIPKAELKKKSNRPPETLPDDVRRSRAGNLSSFPP